MSSCHSQTCIADDTCQSPDDAFKGIKRPGNIDARRSRTLWLTRSQHAHSIWLYHTLKFLILECVQLFENDSKSMYYLDRVHHEVENVLELLYTHIHTTSVCNQIFQVYLDPMCSRSWKLSAVVIVKRMSGMLNSIRQNRLLPRSYHMTDLDQEPIGSLHLTPTKLAFQNEQQKLISSNYIRVIDNLKIAVNYISLLRHDPWMVVNWIQGPRKLIVFQAICYDVKHKLKALQRTVNYYLSAESDLNQATTEEVNGRACWVKLKSLKKRSAGLQITLQGLKPGDWIDLYHMINHVTALYCKLIDCQYLLTLSDSTTIDCNISRNRSDSVGSLADSTACESTLSDNYHCYHQTNKLYEANGKWKTNKELQKQKQQDQQQQEHQQQNHQQQEHQQTNIRLSEQLANNVDVDNTASTSNKLHPADHNRVRPELIILWRDYLICLRKMLKPVYTDYNG